MEEESAGTETNNVLVNDHDDDDDGDHVNTNGDHDDNSSGDIRDDINGDGSIVDDNMITSDVINNNNDPIINNITTTTTTTSITSDNIVSNTEEVIEKDNEMMTTTTIMKMTHNDHQVMNLLHIESNDDMNVEKDNIKDDDVNEGDDDKKTIHDADDVVNDDDNNQPTILNAKSITALATTNIMTIDKNDVTFDPITNIAYCKVTNDHSINQINDHDMVGLISLEGGHENIEGGENGKMNIEEKGKVSQGDDSRTVVMEDPVVVVMGSSDGRSSVLGSMFNKWINDNDDDDDGNNYYCDDDDNDDEFHNCDDADNMLLNAY
jgi:hypothetical protein